MKKQYNRAMPRTLEITRPDDWHVHLRDGELLKRVTGATATQFVRALVMPNLKPPVTTVSRALDYRQEILDCLDPDTAFDPKMALYLTDDTPVSEVLAAAECEHVLGFKLYPAGATTNSASGVTRIIDRMPVFESMAKHGVVLQVHGEVTDNHVDIFDREAVFIEQVLQPLKRELPELRMVLEHVTTSEGIEFVRSQGPEVGATITPQHLLHSRNEMFRGGIRPHAYCLPILKRESHRLRLLEAATSGDPAFFLGTDSAPHTRGSKESDCGCAGTYSANAAMSLYAEIFDGMEAMDKLEAFASHNGADFYGLPRNSGTLTLVRSDFQVPDCLSWENEAGIQDPNDDLVPLMAGQTLAWSIETG